MSIISVPPPIMALQTRVNWPITLNTTNESADFDVGPGGHARMEYLFWNDGSTTVRRLSGSDSTITPWNNNYPVPERDYYIQFLYSSGDPMNVGSVIPTGWLKISGSGAPSATGFGIEVTGNFIAEQGFTTVQISPDSDGARIVGGPVTFRASAIIDL